MRRCIWTGAALALSLAVGVATATAAEGGNSANAKQCQKGGWTALMGSDGTIFTNQDECVSYGAHGGTLAIKQTCTAASEDFSEYATQYLQPTTFTGGTIDSGYGEFGGVVFQGIGWSGGFAAGTHLLFTGDGADSFQLTFTNAVDSLHLDAQSNVPAGTTTHVTLTGYDASNNVVDGDSATQTDAVSTLSISSSGDNIKYFTIATDSPFDLGLGFTNIAWGCAES